jgi:CheY-like chemotaxis protein
MITFNKVLEHLPTPTETSKQAKKYSEGFIYIELPDGEKAIKAGCDEYITKPIKKVDLFELIKKLLKPE